MRGTTIKLAFGVLAAALLVPVASFGDGSPFDSARGGGQVVVDPEDLEGAGDTIAFTAHGGSQGPSGQVTYVATSLAGEEMARWHGTVTCLVVDGDTAELGGTIAGNEGSNVSGRFAIRVTDNGQPAEGTDTILLSYGTETQGTCNEDFGEDPTELSLARGNVTVHDATE